MTVKVAAIERGDVHTPREILAQNVRLFRKARRLTLLDVDLDSGVSAAVIKQIEKADANCRLDTLQLLAAYTGLTVSELFCKGAYTYAGT